MTRQGLYLAAIIALGVSLLSAQPSGSPPVLDTICTNGPPTHLGVPHQPGHRYQWTISGGSILSRPDSNQIRVSWNGPTGLHQVKVLAIDTATGCAAPEQEAALYLNAPSTAAAKAPSRVCRGTAVTVASTTQGPFKWQDGNRDSLRSFIAQRDTTLKLIAENQACPNDTLILELEVVPQPIAEINPLPDTISLDENLITYHPMGPGGYQVIWDSDGQDRAHSNSRAWSFERTGWHTIYQIVSNGICHDTLQRKLYVQDRFTAHFPNAFTPNNDGRNERWIFKGVGHRSYRALIYNRWGELVYEWTQENPTEGWDGIEQGQPAQQGGYFYKVWITDLMGEEHFFQGHLTLIR